MDVAESVEKTFIHPQDIELVIKNDRICIVQSRNITSLTLESEWELLHEFDSMTSMEDAIVSTANVAEVMGIPFTPMGCSLIGTSYSACQQVRVLIFVLSTCSKCLLWLLLRNRVSLRVVPDPPR